jgi:hypothetical protein
MIFLLLAIARTILRPIVSGDIGWLGVFVSTTGGRFVKIEQDQMV